MQDIALLLCVASWGARIKAIGRLQIVYSARVFSGQIKPAIISSLKLVIQPLGRLSWNAEECLMWFGDWWRVSFATPAHSDSSYFYLVLQLCADYGFGGLKFLKKINLWLAFFDTSFIIIPCMNLLKARSRFETRAQKQNEAASSSLRPQLKAERSADQVVALHLVPPFFAASLRPIMKRNPRANRGSPFRYLKMFKNVYAHRNVYKTFNHKPLILSRNNFFFCSSSSSIEN